MWFFKMDACFKSGTKEVGNLYMKTRMMKKVLLIVLIASFFEKVQAQNWMKIYSPADSIWIGGAAYFNKGDTVLFVGKSDANWFPEATQILVSTDGGHQFQLDQTALHLQQTYCPSFQALYLSNKLMASKLNPNQGTYEFQGLNNWIPTGVTRINSLYGEIDATNLFFIDGSNSNKIYTIPASGGTATYTNVDLAQNCSVTHTKGSRIFLGTQLGQIQYVDNGDFSTIQTSVLPAWASGNPITHFFQAGSVLYSVVFQGGGARLLKTNDNGVNWVEIPNPFGVNSSDPKPEDIYGLPDGRIYFIKPGFVSNIFVSTDGGNQVTQVGNGLPNFDVPWTGKKFLSNKNKLWLGVNVVNQTDFVRLDTLVSGLYLLDEQTSNTSMNDAAIMDVYPNPFNDIIRVQTTSPDTKVSVSDALGKVYLELSLPETHGEIHTHSLPQGMYFVQFLSNGKRYVVKMIKN